MLTKIFPSSKAISQLSDAVSDVLSWPPLIKILYFEHSTFFVTFKVKCMLLWNSDFHDFTNFSQHVLTPCVPTSNMVLGTWKGLSEVSFPQIWWPETSYWLRGVRKGYFFRLRYKVGITTFKYQIFYSSESWDVAFSKSEQRGTLFCINWNSTKFFFVLKLMVVNLTKFKIFQNFNQK